MQRTYRAAVIGSTGRGGYGHGLDKVWLDLPNVELVAVADDDKMGLAEAARRLSVEKTFTDYRRMLDEVRPDLVSIGPRWIDQHRDMVVAAAEHGTHIYMEKPFCRTPAEADEMVAACERTHVKLAIAHQVRYSPQVAAAKQLIDEGKLGRVLEFRGRGKEDHRGGGEDLWVLGSHIMDLTRLLGGDPQWCLASVNQAGRPIVADDVQEGNEGLGPLAGDALQAMYGMPADATAYFSSHRGAGSSPSRFGLVVLGSAGALEIVFGFPAVVRYLDDPSWTGRKGASWVEVSSQGIDKPETRTESGAGGGNRLAALDLIEAIEQDRQPYCSVYDGRWTVEMIAGVFESQRVGCRVELPLAEREHPLTRLTG